MQSARLAVVVCAAACVLACLVSDGVRAQDANNAPTTALSQSESLLSAQEFAFPSLDGLLTPPAAGVSQKTATPTPDPSNLPSAATVNAEPPAPAKLWEGSLELGITGTDGNSQSFNLHCGGKVKRKTERNVFTTDVDYHKNSSNSLEIANRAFLESRYEHLFADSPWTWFTHGTADYDRFKDYDLRLAIDTGFGYRWIKSKATQLTSRVGGGVSHEFNSPNEDYKPEGVFGLDFEHRVSKRQKVSLTVDYAPNVTNFPDYRLNSKAAWEIMLDEPMHLSLKFAAIDRYAATKGTAKANDIDYSAMLMWSF